MASYFVRKNDLIKVKLIKECVYCGSQNKLVIDHIYPRNKGGGNELENLTRACNRCNLYKSDFKMNPGTYLYSVVVILKNGGEYSKQGSFMLLR